jgi:hypothetical protein
MEQEILNFNFSIADYQKVEPNQQHFTFFGDAKGEDGGSVTTLSEHEIVDWIFKYPPAKEHFISNVYPDAVDCQFAVRLHRQLFDHGEKPGDVDILLWPKNQPKQSIAIECKRVKVRTHADKDETVNKLEELGKGVIQTNQLHAHRFYKTYIAVLIVTDGQHKSINNTIFRHADSKSVVLAYNLPRNGELNPEVGILFVQLTQPTSKNFKFNHALEFVNAGRHWSMNNRDGSLSGSVI